MTRRPVLLLSVMAFGYAFLYLPIALMVVLSFNESRLVSVWTGFSLRWYAELFENEALVRAAWLSLRIAVVSATAATVLGTIAGFALSRFGRFGGRWLFVGMIAAPLVMPEVITGISLLLLFVSMEQALGWPAGRGFTTIAIAHTTFCTAYVAVVVQARLAGFDRSLEEAAQDLGAPPAKVFLVITLPLIAPAIVAGWLLAFTLSLDDVVVASFVSGPGATTLPVHVFAGVRRGLSPQVNALATLVVATVTLGILAAALVSRNARRG